MSLFDDRGDLRHSDNVVFDNTTDWDDFTTDWCEEAAKNGDLVMLQQAHENVYDDNRINFNVCIEAAENGHVHVLDWALENSLIRVDQGDNSYSIQRAAENGHVAVLEWVEENNIRGAGKACCMCCACKSGNIRVVRWIHENHGRYCADDGFNSYSPRSAVGPPFWASSVEVLEYLIGVGYKLHEVLAINAANLGRLGILQWIHSQPGELLDTEVTSAMLSPHCHAYCKRYCMQKIVRDMVQWAIDEKLPFAEDAWSNELVEKMRAIGVRVPRSWGWRFQNLSLCKRRHTLNDPVCY